MIKLIVGIVLGVLIGASTMALATHEDPCNNKTWEYKSWERASDKLPDYSNDPILGCQYAYGTPCIPQP